ncbi:MULTISPECIES: MarC family protein [Aliivibrio]|uniref:MarC family protein n=1 Tax=Aliivibrio TaxID=511678 RepID=UPI0002E71843|nr:MULTISPECIES: MarC family protein [Aliivibrio]MBD1568444.1 MarC family protein [Aliivibrio sp. S10_S31]MUH97214.1 NAAT family transporter [Aliivibrio fischeri]MUI62595.1 NAAT family transporter [Aliivibrio fischeri]OCH06480.1 MarC family transcriptional regulator [Aliivibrio fischeri]OCH08206.1 MarC family transcriptional regulator [Aliivibrio fischeri]
MISILVTQFVVLWAVIDPIGSVPVYLSQTQHLSAKQRKLVALKAVAIATLVLLFFLIVGQLLLEAMQIPLPAFQVAGGLVLLIFALTMIFGESKPEQEQKMSEEMSHSDLADLAVYPLAIPSIASPGAMMAIVMLTDNSRYSLLDQSITAGVMLVVLLITLGLLLGATFIQKVIGNVGSAIISRVMGLILAAVAVNNLLIGIKDFYF